MNFFKSLLLFNAARTYINQHNHRKQNAGRFLTDREMAELLSPQHGGLVMDGG